MAQRELEVAIEATSVELYSLEVERIDTVVELDETPDADDHNDASSAHSAAGGSPNGEPSTVKNWDHAHSATAHSATAADAADAALARANAASAARARPGRYYAPGGVMRPDESWVDRAPSSGATSAANAATGNAAADHSATSRHLVAKPVWRPDEPTTPSRSQNMLSISTTRPASVRATTWGD